MAGETRAAIEFYTRTLPAEQVRVQAANAAAVAARRKPTAKVGITFDFSVYSDAEIVTQLEALFSKKCAYCESVFMHVTGPDIEHFRPKKGVVIKGTLAVPGYYWLGADWNNLFLACPRCNRKDQLEVAGGGTTAAGGKGNLFPLLDEAKRVRDHTVPLDEEEKVRLLLNPCVDDSEAVLVYDDDGSVRARPGLHALNRQRAEQSIVVYGLFQADLMNFRKRALSVSTRPSHLESEVVADNDRVHQLTWTRSLLVLRHYSR